MLSLAHQSRTLVSVQEQACRLASSKIRQLHSASHQSFPQFLSDKTCRVYLSIRSRSCRSQCQFALVYFGPISSVSSQNSVCTQHPTWKRVYLVPCQCTIGTVTLLLPKGVSLLSSFKVTFALPTLLPHSIIAPTLAFFFPSSPVCAPLQADNSISVPFCSFVSSTVKVLLSCKRPYH